jgi:hypothetical protein
LASEPLALGASASMTAPQIRSTTNIGLLRRRNAKTRSAIELLINTASKMTFVTMDNLEYGRLALAIALVLANIAVWGGVYLEGDRFSEPTKKIGWKMLVASLAVEAAFAAILVVIDSEISNRQKIEIAHLSESTERLRAKNLEFEKAVSPRFLEQSLTSEALKKFADVSFHVISPSDFEPRRMAGQIGQMLAMAEWKGFSYPKLDIFTFPDGITIHQVADPFSPYRDAADALVAVLVGAGIDAQKGFPLKRYNENGNRVPVGPDTPPGPPQIVVEVGPRPLPPSLRLKPEDIPADARGNRIGGNR